MSTSSPTPSRTLRTMSTFLSMPSRPEPGPCRKNHLVARYPWSTISRVRRAIDSGSSENPSALAYAGTSSLSGPPRSRYTGLSDHLAMEVPHGAVHRAERLHRRALSSMGLDAPVHPVPYALVGPGSSPITKGRIMRSIRKACISSMGPANPTVPSSDSTSAKMQDMGIRPSAIAGPIEIGIVSSTPRARNSG